MPWQPEALAAKLAKNEPDELVDAAGGSNILLVRLNDFSRDLALGLESARRAQGDDRDEKTTIGFVVSADENTKSNLGSVADLRASLARSSLSPAPRPFPNELLDAPCYMVLLAERAGANKQLLTLGRASSNDIVLRHPSISKVHAYLQLGPQPVVSDPGSLNHVYVNGEQVEQSRRVSDGDVIKLGAVQCVLCSPVSLWSAVHRR